MGVSDHAPEVTIQDSHLRSLISSGTGQDYQLLVALPQGYGDTDQDYPTLYVMDGDLAFGMVTQIVRGLALFGEVPHLLIVGIGYPVHWMELGPYRTRDFVPEGWGEASDAGGADAFLQFIRDDLFP